MPFQFERQVKETVVTNGCEISVQIAERKHFLKGVTDLSVGLVALRVLWSDTGGLEKKKSRSTAALKSERDKIAILT